MRKLSRILCVCLMLVRAAVAAAEVQCVPLNENVLFFGDQTVTLKYELTSSQAESVGLSWHVVVKRTVIASREKTVQLTANKAAETEFKLELPEPRAGSPLEMELLVKIDDRLAHRRTLKVVPRNPLEGFQLPIIVFDPVGKTAAAFATAGIKQRVVHRESELATVRRSVIIVGEGVSWKDSRTLSHTLRGCRGRDNRVVVLCPSDGELSLTILIGQPDENSGRLEFAAADAFPKLVPEFTTSSVYDETEPPRTLKLHGTRTDVMLGLQDDSSGWWWMQYRARHSDGQLTICTLPVISEWEKDPLPRYLLAAFMDNLTDDE